jgi:glycosyltransferase involved in cell wall biosynthesis
MAKADLHVHSCHSKHPSTWFLQRIGAWESYSEPEHIFRMAIEAGMDYVTITDHNCIDGVMEIKAKYPDKVITGVEATTYFPEDGAKVHVLVWGFEDHEYAQIEKIRENIYDLSIYLNGRGLAHSVAHATFSLNKILTISHIERLLLLFDCFEVINGSCSRKSNDALQFIFASLDADKLSLISEKHGIAPLTPYSWKKGVTAGSDDHSGLFTAKAWTEADASSSDMFVEQIIHKNTRPCGTNNDFRGLAFALYKVAYDYSLFKNGNINGNFFQALNSLIFGRKSGSVRQRIALNKFNLPVSGLSSEIKKQLSSLIADLRSYNELTSQKRVDFVCDRLSAFSDSMIKNLFEKIVNAAKKGDLISLFRSFSASLPVAFFTVPFFTTINVMSQSKDLSSQLMKQFTGNQPKARKRIVWFSDTLTDLNGVSATLTQLGNMAYTRGFDLRIAVCLLDNENRSNLPPDLIELPMVYSFTPSFFNTYTVRIPSVLSSLKLICDADPDEIYVSTPGPVGMLGVLMSKLLHIPCTGVYHTDFTSQAEQIIEDDFICKMIETYVNWAYSCMSSIKVPTACYMRMLETRGFKKEKMSLFRRGVDTFLFSPAGIRSDYLKKNFGIESGITFLYAGRISKEKNIDFLIEIFMELRRRSRPVNLLFAGDGPDLDELRKKTSGLAGIHIAGRIERSKLAPLYSSCHALLFPSITDTFGMVVLEAQSCGLPAIVSDIGGPQEIIIHAKTGYVVKSGNLQQWVEKSEGVIDMVYNYQDLYLEMKNSARESVIERYSIDSVFEEIFGAEDEFDEEDVRVEENIRLDVLNGMKTDM